MNKNLPIISFVLPFVAGLWATWLGEFFSFMGLPFLLIIIFTYVLLIASIVLGIISLVRKYKGMGFAIAGIILSVLGILVYSFLMLMAGIIL